MNFLIFLITINNGQQKPKDEPEGEKKISINKTKKTETSGETTTDKDTEDEKEVKPVKINNTRKSGENFLKPNAELLDTSEVSKKPEESLEEPMEVDQKTEEVSEKGEEDKKHQKPDENSVEKSKKEEFVKPADGLDIEGEKQGETQEELKDSKLEVQKTEENKLEIITTHETNLEEKKTEEKNLEVEPTQENNLEEKKTEETNPELIKTQETKLETKKTEENNLSVSPTQDNNLEANPIEEKQTKDNSSQTLNKTEDPDVKKEDIQKKEIPPDKKDRTEDDEMIEVEDTDDYLLHLEDILKMVHKRYYEEYDKLEDKTSPLPDLKIVIPEVKRKVLAGCHLVFSGLVPSHVPLQRSRAYAVAQSLGATVSAEVTAETTHLVAARAGTAKVNSSRRQKGVHIVTPLWLWQCAERWEKVDERLYPLARGVVTSRHPPAHCGSPQHPAELETPAPGPRLRTDSGRFSDTINPLLTFSSEEMASMDQEVEDLCADDDDSESEAEIAIRAPVLPIVEPDSSSSDSMTGGLPKGWEEDDKKAKKRKIDTTTCTESDLEEDSPSAKFRRGEPLPSDLDLGEDSQDDTQDSQEDGDDSAWNLMGAALEREFLSGD